MIFMQRQKTHFPPFVFPNHSPIWWSRRFLFSKAVLTVVRKIIFNLFLLSNHRITYFFLLLPLHCPCLSVLSSFHLTYYFSISHRRLVQYHVHASDFLFNRLFSLWFTFPFSIRDQIGAQKMRSSRVYMLLKLKNAPFVKHPSLLLSLLVLKWSIELR